MRFDRVDRDFKYILQQSSGSKVVQFLKINNIKNILESMLNLLSTTKKSLNDFLEVSVVYSDIFQQFLITDRSRIQLLFHNIKFAFHLKHLRINEKCFQDFTFSVMKIYWK